MGNRMFKTSGDFLKYFLGTFPYFALILLAPYLDVRFFGNVRNEYYIFNTVKIALPFIAFVFAIYLYRKSRWGALLGVVLGSVVSTVLLLSFVGIFIPYWG